MSNYDSATFATAVLKLTPEGGHASADKIYKKAVSIVRDLGFRGTVLDYGSGTGNLITRLLEAGDFEVVSEADLVARPSDLTTAEWLQADLNHPLPVANARFDCVISLEVIEHLENPRATVREWFRLLKPGGAVIFSTPNNESWQAMLVLPIGGPFQRFLGDWYPGGHITALLRMDIEHILLDVGFEHLQVEYIASTTLKRWVPFLRLDTRRKGSNLIGYARKPLEIR
jgi:2-polyprenyl-3-methyl-5-hydroxy-6-metoxy-1,4-benzoquinol methylase